MNAMDSRKTDLNDYAMPLMNIESMAKQTHHLCLEGQYGEAQRVAQMLCVEARILQQTLRIMEEKEQQRADSQRVQAG